MENTKKIELLHKIVDEINASHEEYMASKDNHKDLIEAIRKATNGSFIIGVHSTTCLGWRREYDKEGREVTVDPNYIDSSIVIESIIYPMTRVGWHVFIWKPNTKASYTTCWSKDIYKYLLTEVDLTPDYVKDYWKDKKEYKLEPREWKDYYVENDYIVNPMAKEEGRIVEVNDDGTITMSWKRIGTTTKGIVKTPYVLEKKENFPKLESKMINKGAYTSLIKEDIDWLLKNTQDTLERRHIIKILNQSIDSNYIK